MSKTLFVSSVSALAAVACLIAGTGRAEVVYDDLTLNLASHFNPLLSEVGDQVVLAGTGRTVTNFNLQYWGLNFSGDEQFRIHFYANDGAPYPTDPTRLMPASILFDSGWFAIAGTSGSILSFDSTHLTAGNVVNLLNAVPDTFTLSVQFLNVDAGAGESAGVFLNDSPTIGANVDYAAYQVLVPNGDGYYHWETRSYPLVGGSFGAEIEATPEPSVLALNLLGGVSLFLMRNRWKRR